VVTTVKFYIFNFAMMEDNSIFELIKTEVHTVLPGSKVLLFGSRANGYATEESNWEILILTTNKPNNKIKRIIRDKLFPLSVKAAAFINTLTVSEEDWNNDPSYYALRCPVTSKKVMA
jgi:predicted nucleotidyltransferase